MSGIAPFALFHVNQIEVTFVDDIGNSRTILGTGFWVDKEGVHYFVTNAHNIEPGMKLGRDTKYQLSKFKIFLRRKIYGEWFPVTSACDIVIDDSLKKHLRADVAVIRSPKFINMPEGMAYTCFNFSDLAGSQWIEENLNAMDVASFIGFPGKAGVPWYDEHWNLAIARTVNIASLPRAGFFNSGISTSDVMLVSGLSFSGSSGSAMISHEKGIVGHRGHYVPPKLIGIMSGHWWNEETDSDVFRHSGLSYLTRSTAIIDLLLCPPRCAVITGRKREPRVP